MSLMRWALVLPGLDVRRSRDASAARIAELAHAHVDAICRTARRLGVPAREIDDVVQDVMLVVVRRSSDIEAGKERAFLVSTTARVAANRRRRRQRRPEEPSDTLDRVGDALPSVGSLPPRSELPAPASEASRCPLLQVPPGAVIMPQKFGVPGVGLHTFEQPTWSCGPLTRRYLELLPPGSSPHSSAPVVIVLHDAGESAETMHARRDRPHFDELAKQHGFILVYANAAPGPGTHIGLANSGAWQRPPRSSLQVDDEEYLRGILADLADRRVVDGSNDVFLVGYRDGAAMALDAARRRPDVYAGVAAFAPPSNAALGPEPAPSHGRHLARVMIVLDASTHLADAPRALVRRWGALLGIEHKVVGKIWRHGDRENPTGSLERLETALPATGSAAVRLYIMGGVVERPPGAPHAWDFSRGSDGADPSVPSDLPDLLPDLVVPDGVSVLAEDAETNAYPSVAFDAEAISLEDAMFHQDGFDQDRMTPPADAVAPTP